MRAWLIFIMVSAVSVRTITYGIQVARSKNTVGGIYIFSIACAAIFLAVRCLLRY